LNLLQIDGAPGWSIVSKSIKSKEMLSVYFKHSTYQKWEFQIEKLFIMKMK